MRDRFSASMITVAIVTVAASVISAPGSAQAPAASGAMPAAATLKTPWGDPDLQGIWTDETNTPLERPAKFAIQEFFTEAQRAELDKARMALPGKDKRAERGTEIDVTGSYNQVFLSRKRTGARTSLVIDPPNGQIPPLMPDAAKMAAAEREYRLALMHDICNEPCLRTKSRTGGF